MPEHLPPLRLLVTSAGSTATQNLLLALAELPASTRPFVVATDARGRHGGTGLADRDEQVPHGADPGFVAAIAALAERYRADLVLPVFGPELAAFAAAPPGCLASGCTLMLSRPEAISAALSKRRLARAMRRLRIATPEVIDDPTAADLPLFLRPDGGTGSRQAGRADSPATLAAALELEPLAVATRIVEGVELSVDGFAWPAGRLLHAICRRRDEVKGGLVVRSTVIAGDGARELARVLVAGLGVAGFFNFQYFATPGGPVVFDLNPRLSGGMALSFAAGLAPGRCLAIAAGRGGETGPWDERIGLELVRRWQNLFFAPDADG